MKKAWSTPNAPHPAGRIAQVSKAETAGIAYISGLISQTADGKLIEGVSVGEQTRIILENMKRIVAVKELPKKVLCEIEIIAACK